jgi:DNA-binding transcriptional regulator YhcF (GntR family)
MSIAQPRLFSTRATPKKLGPPPRRSRNTRDEYFRQLDYLVERDELAPRARDFWHVTIYHYSDEKASDFYPSQRSLAELHGVSRRTVQRRLAAARDAGVLKVAQLKGYDPEAGAWFCSSNTHRPTFVDAFSEQLRASRAAKREKAREARIGNRAQRPGAKPPAPQNDANEAPTPVEPAASPEAVKAHLSAIRETLRPSRPPPDAI